MADPRGAGAMLAGLGIGVAVGAWLGLSTSAAVVIGTVTFVAGVALFAWGRRRAGKAREPDAPPGAVASAARETPEPQPLSTPGATGEPEGAPGEARDQAAVELEVEFPAEPEPPVVAEPQLGTAEAAEPVPERERAQEPEPSAEREPERAPETEPGVEEEPERASPTEPAAEAEREPAAEAEPEPAAETEPEPGSEREPEPTPGPLVEAEPELSPERAPDGGPLRFPPTPVARTALADLGIWPSPTAEAVVGDAVPPYVRRDIDDGLDQALQPEALMRTGGVVVVRGAPASGMSRTLWEAIARHAGERTVLAVRRPAPGGDPDRGRPLPWLARTLAEGGLHVDGPAVVWIDDAHEHLGRGLSLDTLDRLAAHLPGTIVALTVSAWRLALPELVSDPVERWLRLASDAHELSPQLTDDEFTAAVEAFPDQTLNPRLRWLPAWFAGADLLRDRYRAARETDPVKAAVVRAAAVWHRAGCGPQLTRDVLVALVAADGDGGSTAGPAAPTIAGAIDWACEPVSPRRSLLAREPDAEEVLRCAASIVDEVFVLDGPIRAREWEAVLAAAGTRDAIAVGRAALAAAERSVARRAFELGSEAGEGAEVALAGQHLGILAEQDGDQDQAERAYRRVVETGDPEHAPLAAFHLGGILEEMGQTAEAVTAYQQAVASGHEDAAPMAAFNLGWLHENHRRPDDAEQAYQRAIASGHPDAAPMATYNLAGLLDRQRRRREAENLYREALDSGHADAAPMAAVSLAVLLERLQRGREARALLERAAASGHAEAATAAKLRLRGRRR